MSIRNSRIERAIHAASVVIAGWTSRFRRKPAAEAPPFDPYAGMGGFLRFVPGYLMNKDESQHLRLARAQQWSEDWMREFFAGVRCVRPRVMSKLYVHGGHRHRNKRPGTTHGWGRRLNPVKIGRRHRREAEALLRLHKHLTADPALCYNGGSVPN